MAKNQTIQHKRSSVTGNQPSTAQVAIGEMAINFADKSIYTQDGSGNIIELARDIFKGAAFVGTPATGDVWYDTTTTNLKSWDGSKWVNAAFTGKDVLPANTTTTATGSGTSGSPYAYTRSYPSGKSDLIDTITITGLAAGQFVPIVDLSSATNGGRFTVTNNIADDSGTLVFNVMFDDMPSSVGGTSYTANFKVGTGTVYVDVNATITAVAVVFPQSVNFPTNTNSATTSWTSANDTLTSTGDLQISLDGITFGNGPLSITTGDTLYTKWTGSAGSGIGIDSAHGTTITGAVVSSGGGSTSSSLTVDKTPDAITFTAVTGAATSSSINSNSVTLSGVNSYVYLTSADTMSVAVAGGASGAVPASGTSVYATNGQSLQVSQTSGATNSSTTTVNLTAGGTTAAFSVTTASAVVFPQSVSFPTNTVATTTSWTSANNTLTSTGDLLISLDGITFSNGPLAITTGATLYTKWTGGPGTGLGIDKAHGVTIVGAVVDSGGGSTSSTLTIDKTPNAITFAAVTGAALSTATDSSSQTISGVNSYVYLTSANTVSAAVGGSGFNSVPASGTTVYAVSGQTLQLRQTSSATVSTANVVTVTAGGGSTSFSVTTAAAGTINTPNITAPLINSTGISTTPTLTSDAYAITGIVGTHLNTDWEIYTNSTMTGAAAFSSMASTTNLTSWSPTGLSGLTQYWARVRYRSNDGTAIVSSWSPTVTWTTSAVLGENWTPLTAATTPGISGMNPASSIIWNGSLYVAVGNSGICATSSDGTNWTNQAALATATTSTTMKSVTWSSALNLFVTVGVTGKCATSSNGTSWTNRTALATATTNTTMNSVTWSSALNLFVAVGNTGKCATSPDGTNWTNRPSLATATTNTTMDSVTWSSTLNLFVAVGATGACATSPDGTNWTNISSLATATSSAAMSSVTWSSTLNLFVAVGATGACATSPDGTNWTNRPSLATATTNTTMNEIIWAGTQFVAVGSAGKCATSPDGINWTDRPLFTTATTSVNMTTIAWNGTQLVAAGAKKVATSP